MKRRLLFAGLCIPLLLCSGVASQRATTEISAQPESPTIEGPWVEVHALAKDKQKGPGEFYAWVFQGNKVARIHTQTRDGEPVIGSNAEGTYKLNTAVTPNAIDIDLGRTTYQGIYAFDADTLKLCLSLGKRPINFERVDKNQLYVLKRPPQK